MADEDPFKPRTPDFFSVGRATPRAPVRDKAAVDEQRDEERDEQEQAAADPWQRPPTTSEEEAEQEAAAERGANPWDRPSRDSAFSAARPAGGAQSSGSAWTQVRREPPPDEGSTSQSFAVKRYDPSSPRAKENPFASKDQPAPARRVDNSFGSPAGGSAAPPPPRKAGPKPDPPVPDNPFTSKPRENPFASRKRGR